MIIETDKYDLEFFDETPALSIVNRLVELELKPINHKPDKDGSRSIEDIDKFSLVYLYFYKQTSTNR